MYAEKPDHSCQAKGLIERHTSFLEVNVFNVFNVFVLCRVPGRRVLVVLAEVSRLHIRFFAETSQPP